MLLPDQYTAELLRGIIRPNPESCRTVILELAPKVSWEEVVDRARQHGVLPTLYSQLAANSDLVPSDALKVARREFEKNAFHCMTNAEELIELLRAFDKAGIATMPFKGVVLGASAYGSITARAAGDLDLLIYYRDLQRATQILLERGYKLTTKVLEDGSPEASDYFEFHFERAQDGMVVELRWRLELTQPRFSPDLGMDWVWPRRRTVKLGGADVPNLDAVCALLVLCMHGSKHVWSRLGWICDVAKLLETEPGLDWDFAQQEAKRVGLWRCLALGVLLAQRTAGSDVPSDVLRRFEANRTVRMLAEALDKNLFARPRERPPGRIPYNIKILGFRDRLRLVLAPSFLRPNDLDRAVVKLPKALEPLYYVIRPFRMLLDRTGR